MEGSLRLDRLGFESKAHKIDGRRQSHLVSLDINKSNTMPTFQDLLRRLCDTVPVKDDSAEAIIKRKQEDEEEEVIWLLDSAVCQAVTQWCQASFIPFHYFFPLSSSLVPSPSLPPSLPLRSPLSSFTGFCFVVS